VNSACATSILFIVQLCVIRCKPIKMKCMTSSFAFVQSCNKAESLFALKQIIEVPEHKNPGNKEIGEKKSSDGLEIEQTTILCIYNLLF
jgi:hypothetical protein